MDVQIVKSSLKVLSDAVTVPYQNTVLESINDHCLRMAVMEGEYRWHYHQHTDEIFIVLEGTLRIEMKEQETQFLHPGDFIKIPAGIVHKTSAVGRTVNLCFERTGDDTVFID